VSYSLTPVVVDLRKLRKLMGSGDEAVLRAVFQQHAKELFNTDETFDDDFDEFKKEIRAEYKAFVAGDYSGVDLAATYPDREDDEDEEDDAETLAARAEYERIKATNPKAAEKFLNDWVKKAMADCRFDDDGNEIEEAGGDEPRREVSTGAALVHLIMGGNPDPSLGFKYGYALFHLCLTLGDMPEEYDSWCSIRSRTLDLFDAFLKKAGVPPKTFAVNAFLVERGPPVEMPRPDDFPAIGYLDRDEIPAVVDLLDPARLGPVLAKQKGEEREWLEGATAELRSWLETCVRTKRDLVCFYF
jgi:hypothetical protein